MHPVYRITHVGRPIDTRYPTNRAILAIMGVALVGGAVQALIAGGRAAEIAAAAVAGLLTAFFTWALGRELAPDDNPAAFVGLTLTAIAWALFGRPAIVGLVLLGCAVGFARLVARTVGKPAKASDTVVLVVLSLLLTAAFDMTAVGIGAALALALDGLLVPRHRTHLPLAIVPVVAVVASVMRHGVHVSWLVPWWALAGGVAVAVLAIATCPPPRSKCDLAPDPPTRRRVQGGMTVVLLATACATLTAGRAADVAPLWAALGGVAIGRLLGALT